MTPLASVPVLGEERVSEPTLWCKSCRRDRPKSKFLWGGKRGRIRVTFCDDCARANMAAWARTQNVGMRPEDVKDADD